MDKGIKNQNKSKSAKIHFILSSVLIVVLLLTIPVVTLFLLSSTYDEQVRTETQRITSAIGHTIRTFITGAYSMINELADNPSVLSFDPVVQTQILENCVARNPYIDLIYIIDIAGMQTARSSGELGDSSEQWWFDVMMDARQPIVTQSYYSRLTGMPCVPSNPRIPLSPNSVSRSGTVAIP